MAIVVADCCDFCNPSTTSSILICCCVDYWIPAVACYLFQGTSVAYSSSYASNSSLAIHCY